MKVVFAITYVVFCCANLQCTQVNNRENVVTSESVVMSDRSDTICNQHSTVYLDHENRIGKIVIGDFLNESVKELVPNSFNYLTLDTISALSLLEELLAFVYLDSLTSCRTTFVSSITCSTGLSTDVKFSFNQEVLYIIDILVSEPRARLQTGVPIIQINDSLFFKPPVSVINEIELKARKFLESGGQRHKSAMNHWLCKT